MGLAFVAVALALSSKPVLPMPTPCRGERGGGGLPQRPVLPLNWRSSQCRRPLPLTARPRRPGPGLLSNSTPGTTTRARQQGALPSQRVRRATLPCRAATATAAGEGGAGAPPDHHRQGGGGGTEVVPSPPASSPRYYNPLFQTTTIATLPYQQPFPPLQLHPPTPPQFFFLGLLTGSRPNFSQTTPYITPA